VIRRAGSRHVVAMKRDRSRVLLPMALGMLGVVGSWALVADEGGRPIAMPGATGEPVPEPSRAQAAVAIDITADAVRVHGSALANASRFSLERGRVHADDLEGHLVRPLADALTDANTSGPVAITAAAEIPWPTVLDLLYTAGRAGARSYLLVTAGGTIAIEPPRFDPHASVREQTAIVELRWAGESLLARSVDRGSTSCTLAPRRSGATTTVPLRLARDAACRAAPGGVRFVLAPSADADYGEIAEVAGTLDAAASCPTSFTMSSGEGLAPTATIACDAAALVGAS
jgi:hypothetical protein